MHVPFLSRCGHKRLGGRLLRTTLNLCRTLDQKRGVGRCYAVDVYSALYGTAAARGNQLVNECMEYADNQINAIQSHYPNVHFTHLYPNEV